jgi:hypothetical protein
MRLNYRTINECLLGIRDTANNYIDYRWMFAAFVNEEHPWLDVMLNRILEQNVVNRFVGYQLGEKEVLNQVFAIWYFTSITIKFTIRIIKTCINIFISTIDT